VEIIQYDIIPFSHIIPDEQFYQIACLRSSSTLLDGNDVLRNAYLTSILQPLELQDEVLGDREVPQPEVAAFSRGFCERSFQQGP
jgi:hypothetical protein